jgi:hypothetical protein
MNVTRTLAFALLTICTACAPAATAGEPRTLPAPASTVTVTNHNWSTVNVFLLSGGIRHRLGSVNSHRSQRFEIPRSAIRPDGGVRLVVDPVGGDGEFVTDAFRVTPGQVVRFDVAQRLAISSFGVWDRN